MIDCQTIWEDYRTHYQYRAHTVTGTVRILKELYSPELDNTRDVVVYLPPGYDHSAQRYPVIYMHDGQNLFDRSTGFAGQEWEGDETMERLSQEEGLQAIIVGLYHTGAGRLAEYNPFPAFRGGRGHAYLDFVCQTVKPLIDQDFRSKPDRTHTGIMGSSMGGLISLYGFFHCSDVFGFAGVMSPSVWIAGGAVYDVVRQSPRLPGKIYLDNGTRENSARKIHALLMEKEYRSGHDLMYVVEQDAEHTESAWARRLPDALRFLLT